MTRVAITSASLWLRAAIVWGAAAMIPGTSYAADAAPTSPTPPAASAPAPRRASSLDELFARLSASKDEVEANGIGSLIERRLEHSGSDTADLLMSRAGQALEAKDAALAVEILDRVTVLRPDWAEAWSRRATAFYLLEDPGRAVSDLGQALAREPRHYDAMASLGRLELSAGDEKRALEVFRRALAIHPYLKGVQELVDKLAPKVDGRDL